MKARFILTPLPRTQCQLSIETDTGTREHLGNFDNPSSAFEYCGASVPEQIMGTAPSAGPIWQSDWTEVGGAT